MNEMLFLLPKGTRQICPSFSFKANANCLEVLCTLHRIINSLVDWPFVERHQMMHDLKGHQMNKAMHHAGTHIHEQSTAWRETLAILGMGWHMAAGSGWWNGSGQRKILNLSRSSLKAARTRAIKTTTTRSGIVTEEAPTNRPLRRAKALQPRPAKMPKDAPNTQVNQPITKPHT